MKKVIASRTLKKVNVLLAKLDKQAGETASGLLDGSIAAKDAMDSIGTISKEIRALYDGIKTTVTASTKSFTASVRDEDLDKSLSSLSIVATKLDLIEKIASDMMEDEIDEEDVSADDILNDLGVESEEEENEGDESEEEENSEEAEEGETEAEEEAESEEDEAEEEIEEEDDIPVTASKKFVAKKRAVKVVSRKKQETSNIFNFIK